MNEFASLLLYNLVYCLVLTELFELGWFFAMRVSPLPLVRRGGREGAGWDVILVLLTNVVTNPPLVIFTSILFSAGRTAASYYYPIVIACEIAVVLIEGLLYRKYAENIKRPFLFSLTANAFSYGMGVVISTI